MMKGKPAAGESGSTNLRETTQDDWLGVVQLGVADPQWSFVPDGRVVKGEMVYLLSSLERGTEAPIH